MKLSNAACWLLLLLLVPGCFSRITGDAGLLDLRYEADDAVENFNKPIAVGARLDLEVLLPGEEETASLESVSSSAPDVLSVVDQGGGPSPSRPVDPAAPFSKSPHKRSGRASPTTFTCTPLTLSALASSTAQSHAALPI